MGKRKKRRVPEVLWRLFNNRARTLFDTIVSLIPSSQPSTCHCKGRRCLACSAAPAEFLLRPEDPSEYRTLLLKCFVVVSQTAPRVSHYYPHRRWSQRQLVIQTIEMIKRERPPEFNVLCADYNPFDHSSTSLEILTCSSWDLLLRRVGDEFMVYLLKFTLIFLPSTGKNYSQVAGSSASDLFFKTHRKAKPKCLNSSPVLGHSKRKRTRPNEAQQAPEINHSASVEYGPSSTTSCISCNTRHYSTSCSGNTENKRHQEGLSREATLSTGTPSDNEEKVPNVVHQESPDQVYINPRKRGRMSINSMCFPSLCSGISENKEHRKNLSRDATLTSDSLCDNDEKLPNNEYQDISNQIQIKKAQPRESSWRRKRKRRRSATQDSSFCSQSDTNMNNSNTPSGSVHSAFNSTCSCCLMLQKFLNVTTESRIDKWFVFYNVVYSSSAFGRKHILNNLKGNLAGASALMKNIFSLSDETINALSQPCSHSTTSCLKKFPCLYHSLLGLLRKLICKAMRCQHKTLLDKHCPVPSLVHNAESQCNGIQEKLAESEFIPTQCYCPQKQVVSFVWAVCRNILPPNLLGTKSSWRAMRRSISRFVCLRRFESFSLCQGMHKFKLSMFPFLSDGHFLCSLNQNIPNCTKMRYNIMKKWIFWFFTKLVMPLLQTHFYITESEHGKQDIFYYRKSIWRKIMDSTVMRLEDQNHYCLMDEESVRNTIRRRLFGFSKVRLLPKGNGVRVLVNLTATSLLPSKECSSKIRLHGKIPFFPKKAEYEQFKSVNSVLRDLHAVLKGIQLKEPDKLGSSVFNYTDMYKKLCHFLLSLKNGSTSIPTVFIVVADVSKAFDSVNQDKLLEIMEGLIQNDEYLLKKSHQITCKKKSLWVDQNLFLAEQDRGKESFKFPSNLPGVLVNQGWSRKIKKEELQFILNELVKHNILQLDSQYYLQCVGIPQGSILSPLLYSFYYGHLEKTVLLPFVQKASAGDLSVHKSMLVRFIDDFLFISTSKEQASSFFLRLRNGFPGYNCTMNQMKFGRNFDIDQITESSANTMYVGEDGISFLRWSGLFINSRTLEIQADYTRYLKNHIRSTLTICWGDRPGIRLKAKLCDYLRPKCHPIFYDSNINSPVVVRLNIYQTFLLCAMKFHCYFCELSTVCRLNINSCFVILERSLRFMHMCVKKRMFSTCSDSTPRPIFQVERREVEWLGIMAYIRVLQKKETRHKQLISILKSRLLRQQKVVHVSSHLIKAVDDLHSSVIWKIKY